MRAALLVLAVAALAGCGASEEAGETTPAPESALLVITQVPDPGGPMYIEGSLWQLSILSEDGTEVFSGDLDTLEHTERLPPGSYTITSALRPCIANCENLGSTEGACEAEVEVVAPETAVEVSTGAGRPCTIDLR